jgi:hypothetical protein
MSPPATSPAPASRNTGSPTAESVPSTPALTPPSATPVQPPAAVPPAAVQPAAVQPAAVQPAAVQPAAVQPAAPEAKPAGGMRIVELVPGATSAPSPAVQAAQQAAARAAARPASSTVRFKPLQDALATRSAIVSIIGVFLCFVPVFSLSGLVMGLIARRRIQRSDGQITGTGSASLGILLGAAGLAIGITADVVFLLRR